MLNPVHTPINTLTDKLTKLSQKSIFKGLVVETVDNQPQLKEVNVLRYLWNKLMNTVLQKPNQLESAIKALYDNQSLTTADITLVKAIAKRAGIATSKKWQEYEQNLAKPTLVSDTTKIIPVNLLVSFYKNTGLDINNRTLKSLWDLNDNDKESKHDYIQWLFPTEIPSKFNKDAPVLTKEIIKAMRNDSDVMENLKKSFESILKFYGLSYDSSSKRVSYHNFSSRSICWITSNNHNYLRISRILSSLKTFNLDDEANAFFSILSEIAKNNSLFLKESFKTWQDIMGPNFPENHTYTPPSSK